MCGRGYRRTAGGSCVKCGLAIGVGYSVISGAAGWQAVKLWVAPVFICLPQAQRSRYNECAPDVFAGVHICRPFLTSESNAAVGDRARCLYFLLRTTLEMCPLLPIATVFQRSASATLLSTKTHRPSFQTSEVR